MPVHTWDFSGSVVSKTRRAEAITAAVLAVIRDHAPELFTRYDLYDAWDKNHPKYCSLSREMLDNRLRALLKAEVVVQYSPAVKSIKLYYLRTVTEIEKNSQRKLIAQQTSTK